MDVRTFPSLLVRSLSERSQAAMNEEPDNFGFSRLLTSFTDELHELLGTSWCECVRQGFDQHRVERALISSALSEVFDLAV
jgi:hypothetical protein